MELIPNIVFSLILILSLGFFVRNIKRLRRNINFGKGQTETSVKLSSGKHTLTMQFADGAHMSYGKDWSSSIEIEVE